MHVGRTPANTHEHVCWRCSRGRLPAVLYRGPLASLIHAACTRRAAAPPSNVYHEVRLFGALLMAAKGGSGGAFREMRAVCRRILRGAMQTEQATIKEGAKHEGTVRSGVWLVCVGRLGLRHKQRQAVAQAQILFAAVTRHAASAAAAPPPPAAIAISVFSATFVLFSSAPPHFFASSSRRRNVCMCG